MNNSRLDILAPAGNAEMLAAAVYAGANAVYLGLESFSARRTAGGHDERRRAADVCDWARAHE